MHEPSKECLDRGRARVLPEQFRRVVTAQRELPLHHLAELLDLVRAHVEPEARVPARMAAPGELARLGILLDRRDGRER